MLSPITLEQAEEGWFVVECPALPGGVSQGADEKEAITAGLWAEERKAVAALSNQQALSPLVVAV